MTIIHNKLVRDKIPQIIEQSGKSCVTPNKQPQHQRNGAAANGLTHWNLKN